MDLFDVSEKENAPERKFEARATAIARDFLQTKYVNTSIELEPLSEKFTSHLIPKEPTDALGYLDYLMRNVVSHSVHTSSPRFIGHMTSALPYFVRPLASLMTAMNQNTVKAETAKSFTPYERQSLAMLHRLIYNFSDDYYDEHIQRRESTLGILTSGGTAANITALWCLRNLSLGPEGRFGGVEKEGLAAALDYYGYSEAVIIGSSLMHYSFQKAADLLGIGAHNLIKVPTNGRQQIDLRALERAILQCRNRNQAIIALVGVAAATDCGAIDPLEEIAGIAEQSGVAFHVDAAWGGPVLFSERHRNKLAGIERADSVTIDGHKQLYLPMGIGMVMFRDPQLAKSIEKRARYIVRARTADLGRRSLEGSRPAMSLFLHAALHIIGSRGYEFLINEGIRKTRYMADQVRSRIEFELIAEPEINILVYRFIPQYLRAKAAAGELTDKDNRQINRFNEMLQKAQRRTGNSFVSRTTLDNTRVGGGEAITALRVVIANPLTCEEHIDMVLNDQIQLASSLS
jgi:glutamate decarboxylase